MHIGGRLLVQTNKAGWSVDINTGGMLLVQSNKGMTKVPYLCARIMNEKSAISPATFVFEK